MTATIRETKQKHRQTEEVKSDDGYWNQSQLKKKQEQDLFRDELKY
jgi:hypothetical protein